VPLKSTSVIPCLKYWLLAALALEALHKQVLPFLLRRLKEDVLSDLPPKIIQDYFCELSEMQKYLYDDFSKSQARLTAEDAIRSAKSGEQQHIFQSLQHLRKLCNHPAMVLKADDDIKAALQKVGQKPEKTNLFDINHAPKLLALRFVTSPIMLLFYKKKTLQTTSHRLRHRRNTDTCQCKRPRKE
jgi:SNF2 family DNA or RNA helicase